MNKPSSRPEEGYDEQKVLDFLRTNPEICKIWRDITSSTDPKTKVFPQDIWDFVVQIRHGIWSRKEKNPKEKDSFEFVYQALSGEKKFIPWFKHVVGYLLHIFSEEGEERKYKYEEKDTNEALLLNFWSDRSEISKAFITMTNKYEKHETDTNIYQAHILAFKDLQKKYMHIWNLALEEEILDILIRKYNLVIRKKKKKK